MGDFVKPPLKAMREGWSLPRPEKLPRPTYSPMVVAVGVMCIFWGFVTSFLISLLGIVLLGTGLAGWIGELRNEK